MNSKVEHFTKLAGGFSFFGIDFTSSKCQISTPREVETTKLYVAFSL